MIGTLMPTGALRVVDMDALDALFAWCTQPQNQLIILVVMVLLMWLGMKLLRRSQRLYILRIMDPKRAHRWQTTEFLDKPTYCNACMHLCVIGSTCESCGLCICTESSCLKLASSSQSCKPVSVTTGCSGTPHFWVKGNLPLCSVCFKCFAPCGNLPRLADYRCVWCHRTAHEDCVVEMESSSDGEEQCSMGPHQTLVIPPDCVSLKLEGWRGRRRCACVCVHLNAVSKENLFVCLVMTGTHSQPC